jgi:hypothetical protein
MRSRTKTLMELALEPGGARRRGLPSPAGSCVWHVVGLQRSVHEWAIRQGWGGRPVRQEQAQGILVATLEMLAMHFGSGEAKRAP